MTRRERMERRAERRREWADGRRAKAAPVFERAAHFHGDHAFNTQPGHIPERARLIRAEDRAFGDVRMADHHEAKAAGIEAQLERSIFSDDPDAVEALEARIAELEARRDAMKRGNAAYKKGAAGGKPEGGALALRAEVGDEMAAEGLQTLRLCPYHKAPFPPYALTNLGGNIRRLRERIKDVQRRQEQVSEAETAGGVVVKVSPDYVGTQQASVTFAERPERSMLDALKAAGFWFSGGTWYGPAAKLPEDLAKVYAEAVATAVYGPPTEPEGVQS